MLKTISIGLLAFVFPSVYLTAQNDDVRPRLIHYERYPVSHEREPFLEVTDTQLKAWNRIVEQCTPINTRSSLSEACLLLAEEFFSREPVWAYGEMFYYDMSAGWVRIFVHGSVQRAKYSHADFIDRKVPLWGDIFDGRIEQRQQRFLQVVRDESCKELANPNTIGLNETMAEQCAARELYKYATYLNACSDAVQRIAFLQKMFPEDTVKLPQFDGQFILGFALEPISAAYRLSYATGDR